MPLVDVLSLLAAEPAERGDSVSAECASRNVRVSDLDQVPGHPSLRRVARLRYKLDQHSSARIVEVDDRADVVSIERLHGQADGGTPRSVLGTSHRRFSVSGM